MVLRILILLLAFCGYAQGAQLFIVEKGNTSQIVLTSPQKIKYEIREPTPGKVILFLKKSETKKERKNGR